jgi:hypothetical protein
MPALSPQSSVHLAPRNSGPPLPTAIPRLARRRPYRRFRGLGAAARMRDGANSHPRAFLRVLAVRWIATSRVDLPCRPHPRPQYRG